MRACMLGGVLCVRLYCATPLRVIDNQILLHTAKYIIALHSIQPPTTTRISILDNMIICAS